MAGRGIELFHKVGMTVGLESSLPFAEIYPNHPLPIPQSPPSLGPRDSPPQTSKDSNSGDLQLFPSWFLNAQHNKRAVIFSPKQPWSSPVVLSRQKYFLMVSSKEGPSFTFYHKATFPPPLEYFFFRDRAGEALVIL